MIVLSGEVTSSCIVMDECQHQINSQYQKNPLAQIMTVAGIICNSRVLKLQLRKYDCGSFVHMLLLLYIRL